MMALRLVEQGKLDLDRDVNKFLSSWQLPENEYTEENKVTLRGILSHTAGLTVHGFQGYGFGAEVPSLLQCCATTISPGRWKLNFMMAQSINPRHHRRQDHQHAIGILGDLIAQVEDHFGDQEGNGHAADYPPEGENGHIAERLLENFIFGKEFDKVTQSHKLGRQADIPLKKGAI